MKRVLLKSILFFICLGVIIQCAFLPTSGWAQTPEGGFVEDFDSEDLAGWERTPDALIRNGVLRLAGGNFAFKLGDWGDQETTIHLRFNNNEGRLFIHYFATDEGSYNLIFMPEAIVLEKAAGPENVINFAEIQNTVQINAWIELVLRVEGGEHAIMLDGDEIITATDPDPFISGGIGFNYEGPDAVEIESISLQALGEQGFPQPPVIEEEQAVQPMASPTQAPPASFLETLQGFLEPQRSQVDLPVFLINLLIAVVLAYVLGRVYIYWGGSLSNRRKFATNFMLITLTTTFIILVVRSSVALSLGLVGALSIVRFRTAVKEPEELAYLFFAIAIGIGLGDNQRVITLIAFAVVILLIGLLRLFRQTAADVNLHLTVTSHNPQKFSLEQFTAALKPHVSKLKLLRMDETPQTLELAFMVEFKHMDHLGQAKDAIHSLAPDSAITFLDNKGIW